MNNTNGYIGNSLSEQQHWVSAAELQRGANGAVLGATPARDKPMLDVEYDRLEQAALELDQSVQWLINRIQPTCQPAAPTKATDGCREPDAPSSQMRTKLGNLRGIVESISSRISEVRYTIEI